MLRDLVLPKLTDIKVPIYDRKTASGIRQVVEVDVPILLPSSLLSWAWTHHRDRMSAYIIGSSDGCSLEAFWKGTRDDDDLAWSNPAWHGSPCPSLAIPWSTHGDGVPISRPGAGSASLNVISGNSLAGVLNFK